MVAAVLVVAAACGSPASGDDVAVLSDDLVRHPHRAEITVDGTTDEFDVECTLANSTVRVVASSTEAVFNMTGRRDGSTLTVSGFSSRLPDGFSASASAVDAVDLSGDVLTGRVDGSAGAGFDQLSFRIDCRG